VIKKPGDIKLALILDSYKLPYKENLWKEVEEKAKSQIKDFDKMALVKEEINENMPRKGITSIFRYYRKK
jgi:hypothetical protein